MSDRRAQARKVLAKLAAEIGAWPEWKSDEVFQKALVDIAADEAVAEIVAQFGDKILITRHFAMRARRPAEEEAVGRMIFIVAKAMADPYLQMVPAKEIVKKREEWDSAEAKAIAVNEKRGKLEAQMRTAVLYTERKKFQAQTAALPPARLVEDYLSGLALFRAIQAPLNDPIVKHGASTPKTLDVSAKDYDRAQAMRARAQGEGRYIFGRAGDRVTEVFVYAATGVGLPRSRPRFKR